MQQMIFIADLITCSTCFGAPLCPSSGAREYYTSGCCLSYLMLGFQVVGMVWCWGLCVWSVGCCARLRTSNLQQAQTIHLLKFS